VAKLRRRVELTASAQLSRAETTQALVEITTRRGERYSYHTKAVRGSATNPMSREEVAAKCRDLFTPVIGLRRAERLIDSVWRIERLADARSLRPLLRA
jgi:hypothetical protein